jgi:hypothetical protein
VNSQKSILGESGFPNSATSVFFTAGFSKRSGPRA